MLDLEVPGRLVADLIDDGYATLFNEAEFEATRERLSRAAATNAQVALATLDRFQLVPVTGEARLVLSLALRAHLHAIDNSVVRLVVQERRLTLWSERAWRARRASRLALISDLVENKLVKIGKAAQSID